MSDAVPKPPWDDLGTLAAESARWLAPFLPALHTAGARLLELGCGPGVDAAYLASQGFRVTALDIYPPALAQARTIAPAALLVGADLRHPLPLRSGSHDGAVASLSLHYFGWDKTQEAAADIRRVVRRGGALLLRVNATDDTYHGADEGEEIAPNFRRAVNPRNATRTYKRFFDAAAVRAMLADGWQIAHLAHRTITRYNTPKQVWECLAYAE